MIRLELFVLVGILIGIGVTLAVQYVWSLYSKHREERIVEKARLAAIRVRIDDAPTASLLQELSTRDASEFYSNQEKESLHVKENR